MFLICLKHIFPLFVVLLFVPACSNNQKPYQAQRSAPLCGEIITLKAVGADADSAEAAVTAAMERAQLLDTLLDRRKPAGTWVKAQSQDWQSIPQETMKLLTQAVQLAQDTGFLFNPLIGPITKLYQSGSWATDEELAILLPLTAFTAFTLDSKKNRMRFALTGMELDLDAIAQGYVADECLAVMSAQPGITGALADVGGEVAAFGTRIDGTPWKVGIAAGEISSIVAQVELSEGALAVSSNLAKPMEHDGKQFSHILDPRTGKPALWSGTVAVQAGNAATADAWATALFVAGPEEGHKLAEVKGIKAAWWTANSEEPITTAGFKLGKAPKNR